MEQQYRVPVRIIVAVTALNGLFAIAEVIMTRFPRSIEAILPFNYEVLSRNAGLVAGFSLLYISWRLLARKRRAWQIAYAASLIILIGHVLYARSLPPVIIAGLSLIVLTVYADVFTVASEPISMRHAAGLLGLSLTLAVSYGTIGFYLLDVRDFHQVFNFSTAILRTLREYSLVGNNDLVPYTRNADWFLDSLDTFGAVTIAAGVYSLFRPLTYRYATLPTERHRARLIVERYGHDSEDEFKLWPEDKAYFFSATQKSVLAYRVTAGVALVLGEPVGPETEFELIIETFTTFAHEHGWLVGHLYIPDNHLEIYERYGFRRFMVGQDAIIDTHEFATTTIRSKHFRAIMNKFKRQEYRFEIGRAPQSSATLRRTRAISNTWLQQSGRSERGFALGHFDRSYIGRSDLALVYDVDGRLVAFANLIVSHDPKRASIDLMRYEPGSESGMMDFLLASLAIWLDEIGVAELSLGLAPLAGLSHGEDRDLAERIVGRIARYNIGEFSFQGLRQFKAKFKPAWQNRYLAYERNTGSLGITAYAIDRTMKRQNMDK